MWILTSLILGLGLSMDCLALSVTDGLIYQDINKKKSAFIAMVFGVLQGVFPLLGFLLGETFYDAIKAYDHWVAFGLLLLIGGKMLYDGIKSLVKPEEKKPKKFSYPEVLIQGVADSIDAFAVGLAIRSTLDNPELYQIYICFGIIAAVSFIVSFAACLAGKWINKLLHGKYEISEIIGGSVLIGLGIKVLVEGLIELA